MIRSFLKRDKSTRHVVWLSPNVILTAIFRFRDEIVHGMRRTRGTPNEYHRFQQRRSHFSTISIYKNPPCWEYQYRGFLWHGIFPRLLVLVILCHEHHITVNNVRSNQNQFFLVKQEKNYSRTTRAKYRFPFCKTSSSSP